VDLDPDPTFLFDTDPDMDPTPSLDVMENYNFLTFIFSGTGLHIASYLFSFICVIIF
jgi:hypothetical protein